MGGDTQPRPITSPDRPGLPVFCLKQRKAGDEARERVHFLWCIPYEVVRFDFVIISGKSGLSIRARGRVATTAYRKEANSDSDDVEDFAAGEFEQNENVTLFTLHSVDVTETVAIATRRAGGYKGGTGTQEQAGAESSTSRTVRSGGGGEQKGVSTGKFF